MWLCGVVFSKRVYFGAYNKCFILVTNTTTSRETEREKNKKRNEKTNRNRNRDKEG